MVGESGFPEGSMRYLVVALLALGCLIFGLKRHGRPQKGRLVLDPGPVPICGAPQAVVLSETTVIDRTAAASARMRSTGEHIVYTAETCRQIADQIAVAMEAVAGGARCSSQDATDVALRSQCQLSSVGEAFGALDAASNASSGLNKAAQGMEGAVAEASRTAEEGSLAVRQAILRLERLAGQVDGSARKVEALAENGQTIGSVTATIKRIADRTALLALNASIEAARAGEHGVGFAVVAAEVRKLADMSTGAAREIEGLLQTILNDLRSVAQSMRAGKAEADAGSVESATAAAALEEILDSVKRVSAEMSGVVENADAVGRSVREVEAALQTVQAATAKNQMVSQVLVDVAQDTSASARQVTDLTFRHSEEIERMIVVARSLLDAAVDLGELVHQAA
jgi:methyl-accepting chemotaxis protein